MEDEGQRYWRLRQMALDQDWFLVGEARNSKPLGYRLVHVKTGAKGPGHDSEGLFTLDEVEAFLTKEPLK